MHGPELGAAAPGARGSGWAPSPAPSPLGSLPPGTSILARPRGPGSFPRTEVAPNGDSSVQAPHPDGARRRAGLSGGPSAWSCKQAGRRDWGRRQSAEAGPGAGGGGPRGSQTAGPNARAAQGASAKCHAALSRRDAPRRSAATSEARRDRSGGSRGARAGALRKEPRGARRRAHQFHTGTRGAPTPSAGYATPTRYTRHSARTGTRTQVRPPRQLLRLSKHRVGKARSGGAQEQALPDPRQPWEEKGSAPDRAVWPLGHPAFWVPWYSATTLRRKMRDSLSRSLLLPLFSSLILSFLPFSF